MTREELLNLPRTDIKEFDYLLVFPQQEEHPSGFKFLCIVGGIHDKGCYLLSDFSDVIHFPPLNSWEISIDANSTEYLRIFANYLDLKIVVKSTGSDFVFDVEEAKRWKED